MSNLQSGLVLAGLGIGILFAWWSGAFAMIGDEIAGKVRAAGPMADPSLSPAPSVGAAPVAI